MKKKVFMCSARMNSDPNYDLNAELARRMKSLGFEVKYAARDTDQTQPENEIFKANVADIEECDIFVGVFKSYSKNFGAEVGMAYQLKRQREKPEALIGIVYELDPDDIMIYHCFDKLIKPEDLEKELKPFRI